MTKEVTVEFAKNHLYGGHPFVAGDKLTLTKEKAGALAAAGVLKAEKKEPKKVDD